MITALIFVSLIWADLPEPPITAPAPSCQQLVTPPWQKRNRKHSHR